MLEKFLFFVNATNIIGKTKDNFLNPRAAKYLFSQDIRFENPFSDALDAALSLPDMKIS